MTIIDYNFFDNLDREFEAYKSTFHTCTSNLYQGYTDYHYLQIESSEINISDLEDYINHAARADQQRTRRERAEKDDEIELGMIDPQQGKFWGSQKKKKQGRLENL